MAYLIEYRCSCNKLLFKGFLLFSNIEIKCNRCGSLNKFQSKGKNNEPVSFSFFVDKSENVTGSCCASSLIGISQSRFINKHVQNLISYFHKENNIDFFVLPEYRSSDNKFSTWEKVLENIDSNKKDKPSGYHLFGKINKESINEF